MGEWGHFCRDGLGDPQVEREGTVGAGAGPEARAG